MVAGALGAHDVGGVAPEESDTILFSPTDMKDRSYAVWEREVHACLILCVKRGLLSVDEMRRAVEGLEPMMYKSAGYYERWAASMTAVLVERGILTRREVEAALLGPQDEIHPFAFRPGQRVVIKDEGPLRRWRKPHLRIPGYVHGVEGEVVFVVGKFIDPAYAAFRDIADLSADGRKSAARSPASLQHPKAIAALQAAAPSATYIPGVTGETDEPRERIDGVYQPLYTVKLLMRDVWRFIPAADVAEQGSDEVLVDVFHPWLRPADEAPTTPRGGSAVENVSFVNATAAKADAAANEKAASKTCHEHDHHHETRAEIEAKAAAAEGAPTALQPLAEALVALLISKGHFTRADVRGVVETLDTVGKKLLGAKLVARAWVDEAFKAELLKDAAAAAKKLGIATSNYSSDVSLHPGQVKSAMQLFPHGHTVLRVVENTPAVHNLIVCSLCSCWPAAVLGLSPDWYKGRSYRSRAVKEPRRLLAECFGLVVPKSVRIRVHDSTAEVRYLVLPQRPAGTDGWTEDQLVNLITRDALIGVALPKSPAEALHASPRSHL